MPGRKEDRGLSQRMYGHVQQRREVRHRAAHSEGEGDDPHVLDRGVGKEALDVALAPEEEYGQYHREQAKPHQHPRGERGVQGAFHENLAAHDRIDRDVEEEPRQDGGDRCRALGVRIRQPVVQWCEAHLGTVTHKKEDKRQTEDGGLELSL